MNTHTTDLIATNGSIIRTLYGRRSLRVVFSPKNVFQHRFWIADVLKPLLGASFFRDNGLLIDLHRQCLVSQHHPGLSFPAVFSRSLGINGIHMPTSGPFEKILEEFPSLLIPQFKGEVKHNIQHYIPTSGPPLHARPRRLDGDKLRVAKEEFLKMEQLGIVCRSDSPWASPLHVVPKADGSWRPCCDYRRLNNITTDDIQDFNARLAGMSIFSVIDLVKGFHQVPMADKDIPKTAIITLFGLF